RYRKMDCGGILPAHKHGRNGSIPAGGQAMRYAVRIFLFARVILAGGPGFSQHWERVGEGLSCYSDGAIYDLHADTVNNILYGRGPLSFDGNCDSIQGVAIWDGTEWSQFGNRFFGDGYSVHTFQSKVYTQGWFHGTVYE